MKIVAKTPFGLEDILIREIESIGGQNIEKLNRAVSFEGDKRLLYKANLHLRTALRVLLPIKTFQVKNEHDLYKEIKKMSWNKYLELDKTFSIDATVNSSYFNHSKYVALKAKDAIADRFRDDYNKRPNVDINDPDLKINLHINESSCTVSLDSSGDSLHKRGYKSTEHPAPLNEVLAAGLIMLSGWDKKTTFVDPMCGSGTIVTEAALYAHNIAPGTFRKKFGFMTWKDYDSDLWDDLIGEAITEETDFEGKIYGFDLSRKYAELTEAIVEDISMEDTVEIKQCNFFDLSKPEEDGVIIMNPPYDERMKKEAIDEFYKKIGDQLKQQFNGYNAWIFSGNKDALKSVGLRTAKKLTLKNGPIDCKFHLYELYKGTTKKK